MKKPLIAVIAVIVVAGAVAAIVLLAKSNKSYTNNSNPSPATTSPTATQNSSDMNMPESSEQAQQPSSAPASQTDKVTIQDYSFTPAKITVKKGTTVTWTNQDSIQHNVMPDNPSDAFKEGPLLSKGESYSFTFNTAGTYTYHCSPHPFMKGTVEVTE
jgi:amicyanin